TEADPAWQPAWLEGDMDARLARIRGLVWRRGREVAINPERPFIRDLDDLPLPRHDLLPLKQYCAPLVRGPYAFVVTSRGCPAGCRFCIKHVSYGRSVRFRSPEHVLAEIEQLVSLGVRSIHMYADLFTVNREHVLGICEGILQKRLPVRWTCNSRVDFVDEEMLRMMGRAGCWMISWGIESGDDAMLRRMHKGTTTALVEQALRWSHQAGIKNWGYFIIGLPGETEESIRKSIAYAKRLPLDLVLFHIAAPHPGTPFFFEVVENGWFRPGTRWEQVDMDRSTVLDYPNLKAEDLERWARRAFREWAFRPGPMLTYAKMLLGSPSLWRSAVNIGLETLGWVRE
ncbi:MAG: radical SAM protein, partial [Chloroflexi bacterium]|nr:radical SAM protein [Chloroflexota bacterium]